MKRRGLENLYDVSVDVLCDTEGYKGFGQVARSLEVGKHNKLHTKGGGGGGRSRWFGHVESINNAVG